MKIVTLRATAAPPMKAANRPLLALSRRTVAAMNETAKTTKTMARESGRLMPENQVHEAQACEQHERRYDGRDAQRFSDDNHGVGILEAEHDTPYYPAMHLKLMVFRQASATLPGQPFMNLYSMATMHMEAQAMKMVM